MLFLAKVTRRVPFVEQNLPTLPEHLGSSPVLVAFLSRWLFVLLFFNHCNICPSRIYGFILPLWYLQTFLMHAHSSCHHSWSLWSNRGLRPLTFDHKPSSIDVGLSPIPTLYITVARYILERMGLYQSVRFITIHQSGSHDRIDKLKMHAANNRNHWICLIFLLFIH